MAFNKRMRETAETIAGYAASAWHWNKPKKAIPFVDIALFLVNLFQNCKPKTEKAADTTLKTVLANVSSNGVAGCCDVVLSRLPEKKRQKVKRKMERRFGKGDDLDRAVFALAMSTAIHRAEAGEVLVEAVENDEFDDEEDDS